MTYLWVWLQLFPLTTEWGEIPSAWTLYGAEIRKTSAYRAPRAFCLVLNGADRFGLPYQSENPRLSGYADSAQSPCIALSQLPVWVSFAYQRGGLMDPPETDDTLSLWGLTQNGEWRLLWQTTGSLGPDSAFTTVHLRLEDPAFQHSCFRLKWTNWGSTYGLYDNWLIAYTYVQSDTLLQRPVWQHLPRIYDREYGTWPSALTPRDSLTATLLAPTSLPVQAQLRINSMPYATAARLASGGVDTVRWGPLPPMTAGTYALTWSLATPMRADSLVLTDTLRVTASTWGYDDGEMESGYGLREVDRAFCQVFSLDTPTAITRIGVRFFPVPTQYGKPFRIGVWKLSEGTTPLYLQFARVQVDSLGGFTWYALDTPVVASGQVGVGFIQADAQPLGVGWDATYEGPSRVYVQRGFDWVPSQLQGCLLVRIETGSAILSLSQAEGPSPWRLYPSVVEAGQPLRLEGQPSWPIQVWDGQGNSVALWAHPEQCQAPLVGGLYVCRDHQGRVQRLIVFR
ncbi:MAG: hypothetical protein D6750_06470 [Bacteroidetes bacterium]|nr:MAG: hypothetical protein D6750_06470 [Bacteroidota bacterium]